MAIFTMEGITAIHFALPMTLSGIALSGVAIISSKTLADWSIRFAMSDWSLSAAQLTPIRVEQILKTRRHPGNTEEIRLICGGVLFCAPREHTLFRPRAPSYPLRNVRSIQRRQ